jgi:hypothetical protein
VKYVSRCLKLLLWWDFWFWSEGILRLKLAPVWNSRRGHLEWQSIEQPVLCSCQWQWNVSVSKFPLTKSWRWRGRERERCLHVSPVYGMWLIALYKTFQNALPMGMTFPWHARLGGLFAELQSLKSGWEPGSPMIQDSHRHVISDPN